MARVFIGVGHGGADVGAVANGFKESNLNLSIALACKDALVRNGVTVGMSRTRDENDPLTEEIRECNNYNPQLAVEIHNNAGGGDGAEVFYSRVGGKSKELAQSILNEIVKIGQNSRGIKTKLNSNGSDYYGWIRQTNAPAVIVECAFLDSADIRIIDTLAEQKAMGEAIARGILNSLGIQAASAPVSKPVAAAPVTKAPTYTFNQFVREVQAAEGAGVDGIPGPETLRKTITVSRYKNSRHAVIKPLQRYLNSIGYNCGAVDGIAGQLFDKAVRAYQKNNGCYADGEITARCTTWKKLLKLG